MANRRITDAIKHKFKWSSFWETQMGLAEKGSSTNLYKCLCLRPALLLSYQTPSHCWPTFPTEEGGNRKMIRQGGHYQGGLRWVQEESQDFTSGLPLSDCVISVISCLSDVHNNCSTYLMGFSWGCGRNTFSSEDERSHLALGSPWPKCSHSWGPHLRTTSIWEKEVFKISMYT